MDSSNIVDVDQEPDLGGDESNMGSDKNATMFVHVGSRLMQDNGLKYVNEECNNREENKGVWAQSEVNMEEDLVIDIPELTDNEDEETVEARKNLMFFNNIEENIEKELDDPTIGVNYGDAHTATGSSAAEPSNALALAPQNYNDDDVQIGSDEEDSYISTSNEEDSDVEHAKRRRATHMVYQDPADDGIPDIRLGMIFVNKQQFRAAVDKWNLKERRDIKWIKNDKRRCRATCVKDPDCPWRILLAKDTPTNSWMVKTFVSEHTCNWQLKKNKRCNSKVAAKYLVKQRGYTALYLKAGDIFKVIRRELSVELSFHQVRKVKEKIGKVFEGDCKMEYGKLWDYAAELRAKDPAATIIIEAQRPTPDYNPIFLRMYICFSAMKLGFVAGCRRVIGLDGAFLKGAHKGVLLVAISRDANNQMYPLAWAVVEAETTQTWTWFLEELQKDMVVGNGKGFTFISDQQKGLLNAIEELFLNADQRTCARHKYANFRKTNRGKELQQAFWKCVKATNESDFNKALNDLGRIKASAVDAILNTHPKFWSKAFFSEDSKCDVVDNNMCEVFNGLIMEARHKVIFSMLEDLRGMCARRTVSRREYADRKFVGKFGPRIWEKIVAGRFGSRRCTLLWPGGEGYEVDDNGESTYVVNIDKRTCSCREWNLTGIPCRHAITVINYREENDEDYVAHWYSKAMFLASYKYEVPTIEGMHQWKETKMPPIQPPIPRKMPGRPKKKRVLEEWEGKTSAGRKGRLMTCQRCFKKGHNSRSCKGVPPNTKIPSTENTNANVEAPVDANIGVNVENPRSQVEDNVENPMNQVEDLVENSINQVEDPVENPMNQVEDAVSQVVNDASTPIPNPSHVQQPKIVEQKAKRKQGVGKGNLTTVQPNKRARKGPDCTSTAKVTPIAAPQAQAVKEAAHQRPISHTFDPKAKGKEPMKPPKPKPKKQPFSGIGIYTNPTTGFSMLNPGEKGTRVLSYGDLMNKTDKVVNVHPAIGSPPSFASGKQFVTASQLQAQAKNIWREKMDGRVDAALDCWGQLSHAMTNAKQGNDAWSSGGKGGQSSGKN